MGILIALYFSINKMGKIMKKGRVVILLAGRQAGKKAIIIKQNDEGKKGRKFPHALVAGVERCPRKVTRTMGKKKVEKSHLSNLSSSLSTTTTCSPPDSLSRMISTSRQSSLMKPWKIQSSARMPNPSLRP